MEHVTLSVAQVVFVRRHAETISDAGKYGDDRRQDSLLLAWSQVYRQLADDLEVDEIVDIVVSVKLERRGKLREKRSIPADKLEPIELLELLDDDDRQLATYALRGASSGMISRRLNWPEQYCSDSQVWQAVDKLILLAWLRMQVLGGIYSFSVLAGLSKPTKRLDYRPLRISDSEAELLADTIDATCYTVAE